MLFAYEKKKTMGREKTICTNLANYGPMLSPSCSEIFMFPIIPHLRMAYTTYEHGDDWGMVHCWHCLTHVEYDSVIS